MAIERTGDRVATDAETSRSFGFVSTARVDDGADVTLDGVIERQTQRKFDFAVGGNVCRDNRRNRERAGLFGTGKRARFALRKMRRGDTTIGGKRDGALDPVFELANVAGPRMRRDRSECTGFEARRWSPVPLRVDVGKMSRERFDFFPSTSAQGREFYFDNLDAIIQIFTKTPISDGFFQIAMCGANDADVGAHGAATTDPFECTILKESQELALNVERQVTEFVKKKCSAFGQFHFARDATICARKCTSFVAEELTLDELRGQRRAIDRDKRSRLTARVHMNGASEETFAAACFTTEKNGGIRLSCKLYFLVNRGDCRASSNDAVERTLQNETRIASIRSAQRGHRERSRQLTRERYEVAFVFFVEGSALLVEQLNDTSNRCPQVFANGRNQHGSRGVSGRFVRRWIEACVA